jgi:hypothetical protein
LIVLTCELVHGVAAKLAAEGEPDPKDGRVEERQAVGHEFGRVGAVEVARQGAEV